MNKPSDSDSLNTLLRNKIIGLGEQSLRKSYYPQLVRQIEETEAGRRILAESEARYRSLVENINEIIFSLDAQCHISYISPVALKLCGISPIDIIGQAFTSLIYPDDHAALDAWLRHVQAGGNELGEFRLLKPDGDIRYMQMACRPLYQDGQIASITGVMDDITERKQAEAEISRYRDHLERLVKERTAQLEEANAELLEARDAAEAANRAKSTFLANMSHELRTPLNAILGFSEMIARDGATPEPIKERVAIINRSGEHLLSMITDVLDLSKIEAGKLVVEPEAMDLPALIEDIAQMFEVRAETVGLRFSMELAPDIATYIITDGKKLRQVLINLLGNAVKFTQEGGFALRVRTQCLDTDPTAVDLHLEVKDSGPGIPPDQLQNIFKPFVQVGAATGAQKGTGLGLSISKSLVELMGGEIGVESAPGQGALFWVKLPVTLAEGVKAAVTVAPDVIDLAQDQPSWRILVAEDNLDNRLLLVNLLHAVGFEVREAENGQEAVALFEQWQPHFIWMDMRMPVLNGYEATRRIRALPGGAAVKIVALTASAFREQRQHILDAGCNGIVHKPYLRNEIFDAMAKHLEVRYVYQSAEARQATEKPMAEGELNAAIRGLAQSVRNELIEATQRGDQERFEVALKSLQPENHALAVSLKQLSDDFRYDKILSLLIKKARA